MVVTYHLGRHPGHGLLSSLVGWEMAQTPADHRTHAESLSFLNCIIVTAKTQANGFCCFQDRHDFISGRRCLLSGTTQKARNRIISDVASRAPVSDHTALFSASTAVWIHYSRKSSILAESEVLASDSTKKTILETTLFVVQELISSLLGSIEQHQTASR